jgi:hypothetical protein
MIRIGTAVVAILLVLAIAPRTSAARGVHAPPTTCVPGRHTLLANRQAQVYAVRESSLSTARSLRACAYGHARSFHITVCTTGNESIGPGACTKDLHVTLTGALVAYEEFLGSRGKYPFEGDAAEWYVVVRDLRTGRIVHKVPTGTPLTPKGPRHVGVGNIVALALKGDGSVAWIAEDYGRTQAGPPVGPEGTRPAYFDVYVCDKSGTRLLAGGTNIDPTSLALSVGGTGIGRYPSSEAGKAVYWMQGGQAGSAVIN